MVMIQQYFQLLRIHHWIKNALVFVPFFFSINILNRALIVDAVLGFVCFSLVSSVVYIINDIRDIEKDRRHSVKCRRPLASGTIPVSHALIVLTVLLAALLALLCVLSVPGNLMHNLKPAGLLLLYLVLNIAYSCGLKNVPIADVTILASGYVIRVLFGASIAGVAVSVWLYLVIITGSYYLGLGKRRNEIQNETETRAVMKFYSFDFLDKNMYVCQTLCVMFYALWSIDPVTVTRFNSRSFVFTVPFILIIFFKYSLNIEIDSDGDPTSVLLKDKILVALCAAYIVCVFCIMYFNRAVL